LLLFTPLVPFPPTICPRPIIIFRFRQRFWMPMCHQPRGANVPSAPSRTPQCYLSYDRPLCLGSCLRFIYFLLSIADPTVPFISLSPLLTTPRISFYINLRHILVSLPLFSLRFDVLVPPSYSISVSFLTCISSVSLPISIMVSHLLGLFPVFGFKMYAGFCFPTCKVMVPHFSVVPSLLLYAIVCAAHIISLLPLPKMRPFGRTHFSRIRTQTY
jgi:hypothetical protein